MVIAAVGLSGLLGRLLVAGTELATGDVAGLARSLAFALIGGPLAALLWWVVWRRLDDETERASVGWGLYVTGVYVLSLMSGDEQPAEHADHADRRPVAAVAAVPGHRAGLGRRLGLAPVDVAASPQAAAGPR